MTEAQRTVAFYTLGCKVNQYDTEAMKEAFLDKGYRLAEWDGFADVYIINTCTVTGRGDAKSRQAVRRAIRQNPDAIIAVTGCYSQVDPGAFAEMPGVSVVAGTNQGARMVTLVEQARDERVISTERSTGWPAIAHFEGRTRAVLKIQEGCEQYCSYCIVPRARGRLRSREAEDVVNQVRRLAEAGFKEIVLTGVHIGAYGKDMPGKDMPGKDMPGKDAPGKHMPGKDMLGKDMPGKHGALRLSDLVRMLERVPGLHRLRISSIEPIDVDEDLFAALRSLPAFCDHLHIPLQSGDDRILKQMNRPYSTSDFAKIVETARSYFPDLSVSTDIIVGFPGETEAEFENTMQFTRSMGFSRLHVFRFSARRGTPAALMDGKVHPSDISARSERLISLGHELMQQFHSRFVGRQMEVLAEESSRPPQLEGLTRNYIRTTFEGNSALVNELSRVTILRATESGCEGRIAEQ